MYPRYSLGLSETEANIDENILVYPLGVFACFAVEV
jgi:hypothetical protein